MLFVITSLFQMTKQIFQAELIKIGSEICDEVAKQSVWTSSHTNRCSWLMPFSLRPQHLNDTKKWLSVMAGKLKPDSSVRYWDMVTATEFRPKLIRAIERMNSTK